MTTTNEKTAAIHADTILHAENAAAHEKRNATAYAAHAVFEAAGKTSKARRVYLNVCDVANALYESEYVAAHAAAAARAE